MEEEKEVRWGQMQVGQTIKFWSHANAQYVRAEHGGVARYITLHQNLPDDCLEDFYLNAVIESMNAVLCSLGLQLRCRGVFFVNADGIEEELGNDHQFVTSILSKFWGEDGEWSRSWKDFALCRDFSDEFDKPFLIENGQSFEPYISYVIEAV